MTRVLALLLFALLCTCAVAHPAFFIEKYSAGQCNSLPEKAYHPHGAPEEDKDIHLGLLEKGKPVLKYCPGHTYKVKVSLPALRQGLLTSNLGSTGGLKCTSSAAASGFACCEDKSGVRWVLSQHEGPEHNLDLVIPCSQKQTGDLVISVATSSRAHDSYHTARSTFAQAATCSACGEKHITTVSTDVKNEAHHEDGHEDDKHSNEDADHHDHHDHDHEDENDHDDHHGDDHGSNDHDHADDHSKGHHHSHGNATTLEQHAHKPLTKGQLCKGSTGSLTSLGYRGDSTLAPNHLTLHWTYGDCVPSNPCTQGANWRGKSHHNGAHLLHVAAEGHTKGYVSVGFGADPFMMAKNDVVLGYVSETSGSVEAYSISSHQMDAKMAYAEDAGVISYAGVIQTSDGRTIICFGRPLEVPSAKYSAKLKLEEAVAVNWATSDQDKLAFHNKKGGLELSLLDGTANIVLPSGYFGRRVHGAMMLLAWLVMAPLGILAARHKWAFNDNKVGQTHAWFVVHRAMQAIALLIQFGSGAYALVYFQTASSVGRAHKVMGIITLLLALLQVSFATLRPKPDSKYRSTWFLTHQMCGAFLLALSWTTGILGIFLMRSVVGDALLAWFTPSVGMLVALVVLDLFLQQQHGHRTGAGAKGGFKLSGRRDVALPEFQRLKESTEDF